MARQCGATNTDGIRCTMPAGHHAHTAREVAPFGGTRVWFYDSVPIPPPLPPVWLPMPPAGICVPCWWFQCSECERPGSCTCPLCGRRPG